MMNFSRKRNRALTPAQTEEVQKLAYELVRERLTKAFGADGMWSVNLRRKGDTEVLFGATVAETLAHDIATQLGLPAPARMPAHEATPVASPSLAPMPLMPAMQPAHVEVMDDLEAAQAHAA
jgi:hypothetical protein